MFKNMLPKEAQVSPQSPSKMDTHFQRSAFAPLAIAMHTAALRLKVAIKRFTRNRLA